MRPGAIRILKICMFLTLFCFVLVSVSSAQWSQYSFVVDYNKADHYYINTDGDGNVVIHYFDSYRKSLIINKYEFSSGKKLGDWKIQLSNYFYVGSEVTRTGLRVFYTSKSTNSGIMSFLINKDGLNRLLEPGLSLNPKEKKILLASKLDQKTTVFVMDKDKPNQLQLYSYFDGNWTSDVYMFKEPKVYKKINDSGIYDCINSNGLINFSAGSGESKVFYDDKKLVFVVNDESKIFVEAINLVDCSVVSHSFNQTAGRRNSIPFYHKGYLYQLGLKSDFAKIEVLDANNGAILSENTFSKGYEFDSKVTYTEKYLKENIMKINDVEFMDKIKRGEAHIIVKTIQGDQVRVYFGSNYQNKLGYSGGPTPFGLLFFAATTGVRNLKSLPTYERYYRVDFEDALLGRQLEGKAEKDLIMKLDNKTLKYIKPKQKYLSQVRLNGENYLVRMPKGKSFLVLEKL